MCRPYRSQVLLPVIDTLRKHKFYLSEHKLQFFKDELRILGHVIDKDGSRMDPDKVDKIVYWKTPTSNDLLAGFIGTVGCHLAVKASAFQTPAQTRCTK